MPSSERQARDAARELCLVPCFVCGKELTRVNGNEMQPYSGLVCSTHGNYGSRIMDSMFPEDDVRFLICDDCMVERRDRIRTIIKVQPRATVSYKPWKRVPETIDADA